MLAALLCNLEGVVRGPILREQGSASVGRDVYKAANQIEQMLYPMPAKSKAKVKRALEKVYEYSELPSVDQRTLGEALKLTQTASQDIQSLLQDLNDPEWLVEMRVVLEQLTLIAWALNDDEEALLLLM